MNSYGFERADECLFVFALNYIFLCCWTRIELYIAGLFFFFFLRSTSSAVKSFFQGGIREISRYEGIK